MERSMTASHPDYGDMDYLASEIQALKWQIAILDEQGENTTDQRVMLAEDEEKMSQMMELGRFADFINDTGFEIEQ